MVQPADGRTNRTRILSPPSGDTGMWLTVINNDRLKIPIGRYILEVLSSVLRDISQMPEKVFHLHQGERWAMADIMLVLWNRVPLYGDRSTTDLWLNIPYFSPF